MKHRVARSVVVALAVASALAAPAPPAASAHKFHTSFAEADYDAEARSLQITLRTFPDDLEAAIRRRGGRRVSPDDRKAYGARVFAYLQETFQLRTAKGEAAKLSWVGMDAGVDSAWLYFEAALPEGVEGAQLRQQFLCDLYDDQINLVNVKAAGGKVELRFERGGGFKTVSLK